MSRPAPLAPAVVFVALLAVYAATLAPDVTFWDAGEFLAAAHAFGIPHPPGTPLWVALANTWGRALGVVGVPFAVAVNLLSATCTAATGACTAWLAARWGGDRWTAIAAGLGVGGMATLWLNATETEVYAASLLLGVLAVACAERYGAGEGGRWLVAAAYCLALGGPVHLSVLVVAPGVVLLAARRDDGTWSWGDALLASGASVMAIGAGSWSAATVLAGAGALAVACVLPARLGGRADAGRALALAGAVLLGATGLAILLLRARHDPAINQGNPATLALLGEVVARRQYDVAPLWPRQAPAWIQLANLLQYADLQAGLGLGPSPTFAPGRSLAALGWVALGVVGAGAHRRRHARSWLAALVLLVAGSVGVAAHLNLKAGPTIGWGILPDSVPHEARERDYFFTVAWWVWGAWAGAGAVALARRWRRPALGLALAALPVALNWRGVTRRAEPEARVPLALARGLLESAPPGAVLLLRGDNDTYPVWYAQQVLQLRPDVTPVTVSLVPADWYRAELGRRSGLTDPRAPWRGTDAALRDIAARAARTGRPLAASVAFPAADRATLGAGWRLTGLVWVRDTALAEPAIDVDAARRAAAQLGPVTLPDTHVPGGLSPRREPIARWARGLLACPRAAAATPPDPQLDMRCNVR